uniref:Uncharacterized protein n=1 Tax=Cajanus cajan TaxID=3821 RepID=A0A151SXR1_CAJCA|nr:hypothetical protein KK1_015022 [Cajanus cajan]
MYFTALRDSTIHPGKGLCASSMWGGIKAPQDELGNTYGPSSKFPFFNKLAAPKLKKKNGYIMHTQLIYTSKLNYILNSS